MSVIGDTVRLLLPAVMPSWRFFDGIAPSPRIEYRLLDSIDDESGEWREFRPRPRHVSIPTMLARLVWNPVWNETLFLVSCSERLMESPTEHSRKEILSRIARDLRRRAGGAAPAGRLQFRLVFVSRQGGAVVREITHVSAPEPFPGGAGE